jgi:adenylyl-sulfate kinase
VSLEAALTRLGGDVVCIDGDELRQTICRDLGFSRKDRAENVRRAGGYALDVAQASKIAIVSLVSPYAADREGVRQLHRGAGLPFVEVHVECPLAVAEARDPKGLYRRARAGELKGLTGLDDPYEPPIAPEIVLDTSKMTIEVATRQLLQFLTERGVLGT